MIVFHWDLTKCPEYGGTYVFAIQGVHIEGFYSIILFLVGGFRTAMAQCNTIMAY